MSSKLPTRFGNVDLEGSFAKLSGPNIAPVSEFTLRDYLIPIFRHKAVILTTFFTVMMTVFVGVLLKTPVYEAEVMMLVSFDKSGKSAFEQSQANLTHSTIVYSDPVLTRVVKALELDKRPWDYEKKYSTPLKALLIRYKKDIRDKFMKNYNLTGQEHRYNMHMTVEGLRKMLEVAPVRETDLFTIKAFDFDPEAAANIANVVSRSCIIYDLEQQLAEMQMEFGEKNQKVVQLRDNISKMEKNLTGEILNTADAIGPGRVKVVEQAQVPFLPAERGRSTTLMIALPVSIFLGFMLAYVFEYIDKTFKSPEDIESFFNLPHLGSIPKSVNQNIKIVKDIYIYNPSIPAYHQLSEQIFLSLKNEGKKTLLITAPSFTDGSTVIAVNTCKYLSQKEHKVLLVDANLRSPSIHKAFNLSSELGLANILEGKNTFENASYEVDGNLRVLTAGKTSLNPITLLTTNKMQELIDAAKEHYEIIIVDYPNLKNLKDVSTLSSYLDGVVLVLNEGKTKRNVVKSLLAPMEQLRANLLGIILNNRTYVIPKFLYKWI